MSGAPYNVVWPSGKQAINSLGFAKRIDSLESKTVAYFWDDIFRGDEIYPVVTKELSKKYKNIKFIHYNEFGNTHDNQDGNVVTEIPVKLKRHGVDAVISGVGC